MKTYTFTEYKLMIDKKESAKIEHFLEHLKKNKKEYKRLVMLLALLMNTNIISYCASAETEISNTAMELINLLRIFAKYGCICMGIKSILEECLKGASFKEASTSAMQYFLIYVLLNFYPKLFSMIKF